MSEIMLLDCTNEDNVHVMDSDTGALRLCLGPTIQAPRIAGYATWKSVDLFRRRCVFIAVYCDGERLILLIPSGRVDLVSDTVRGSVRLVAPFVREFRLIRGEQIIYSCSYWYSGWRVWPDDGDIFSMIEGITESPESVARTHRIWTARLEGRSIVDGHS